MAKGVNARARGILVPLGRHAVGASTRRRDGVLDSRLDADKVAAPGEGKAEHVEPRAEIAHGARGLGFRTHGRAMKGMGPQGLVFSRAAVRGKRALNPESPRKVW
jgi:hypothetical protein